MSGGPWQAARAQSTSVPWISPAGVRGCACQHNRSLTACNSRDVRRPCPAPRARTGAGRPASAKRYRRSAGTEAVHRGRGQCDRDTLAALHLVFTLAALAESLADLRDAQDRLHQARAARHAAGQLRDYRPPAVPADARATLCAGVPAAGAGPSGTRPARPATMIPPPGRRAAPSPHRSTPLTALQHRRAGEVACVVVPFQAPPLVRAVRAGPSTPSSRPGRRCSTAALPFACPSPSHSLSSPPATA
jgi:hypothetical protein